MKQTSTQTEFCLQVDCTCFKPRVVILNYITVPQHRHGLGLVDALGVGSSTLFRTFMIAKRSLNALDFASEAVSACINDRQLSPGQFAN